MFRYPTIRSLVGYLKGENEKEKEPAAIEEIDASLEVMDETLGLMDNLIREEIENREL
jgi:hypothetical protein